MQRSSMIVALLLGTASAPPAAPPSPAIAPPPAASQPAQRTSPFASEADRARGNDPATIADKLALTRDSAQRMTVMVSVGGQGPFAFLVDTGSERTAISRQLASRLGLRVGEPVRVHSVLGSGMVDTVHIPQLGVGRQALSVVDAPTFEDQHIGAAGILGIDSLRSQRVVFDFKGGTMQIAPSRHASVAVEKDTIIVRARSRNGRLILTSVSLDGVPIAAIIDTGAQVSIGNLPLLRKLQRAGRVRIERDPDRVSARRSLVEAVTGEVKSVDMAQVQRLDLGGVEVEHVAVAFAEAQIFKELGYDRKPALLLGIDAMRSFDKVSIDFAQKKVRFVLPEVARTDRYRLAMQ